MRALVTGGAGFIGSNLALALRGAGHEVRILDDLSTGYADNVPEGAELIVGDVADPDVVARAVAGCEVVFHQAALRAVLRSVHDPLATDRTNSHGTLVVLKGAIEAGVRRVVSASSSSVYGGAATLPTPESADLVPRSPYAVSKLAGEHYSRVCAELYGIETVSLRYFNVYGARQRPDSAYAAVIPLFIAALRWGRAPEVHGDGLQTRSFGYIDDVVGANLAAATAPAEACHGQAYNIGGSERHSIMDLLGALGSILGVNPAPIHTEPRAGDVRHTFADLTAARLALKWHPSTGLEDGLRNTVEWFLTRPDH